MGPTATALTSKQALGRVVAVSLLITAPAYSQHHHHHPHRHGEQDAAPSPIGESPVEQEQRRGLAMLQSGQNEEALALFRTLYDQTREPRALWRMATAEAALGHWVAAEEHMSAAFASASDPWVQSDRAGLEGTLRQVQARVGLLTVRCNAPDAQVTVDDRVVTNFPVRVAAGEVGISVGARGYRTVTLTVVVPGDVQHPMVREVTLTPQVATTTASGRPAPVATPPARGSTARALGITGLALGGAGLATGVVGLILRNGAANRFNANGTCGFDVPVTQGGTGCADEASTGDTMQALSVAGFVAGGILTAAGVVLLAAAPGQERRPVVLTGGPGQVGIGVRGAW